MNKLIVKDLINICEGKLIYGNEEMLIDGFSIDTRTITKKEVYIGLKGDNFNGNGFYLDALAKGSIGCILDKDTLIDKKELSNYKNCFIILVDNTEEALVKLAIYKRNLADVIVIGITGSVGKTSTRDIIANVLSKKYKTLKPIKNYNNKIGVALTLLALQDQEVLVAELGMNNAGEIRELSKIVKPDIAVITNIGTAHIGNLGSQENILKAKLEILEGMKDKVVVINNDDKLLHNYYLENKDKIKFITYGMINESMYKALNIKTEEDYSEYQVDNDLIRVNVPGMHYVINSLCAYAVGKYFKIEGNKIKDGISNFNLTSNRMEIVLHKGSKIINDCYNANIDSMSRAIEYLGTLKGRKIAVLGDMLELGAYSIKFHKELGDILIKNCISLVILVGNEIKVTYDELLKKKFNGSVYYVDNNKEAVKLIRDILQVGDNVLIKASNSMKFIEIYKELIK